MLATLFGALAVIQAELAPKGWQHELVVHESFEDFYADGMASAYRSELNAEAPVALTAGHVHGGPEQIDAYWDSNPESRAPEWLDGFYESRELVVEQGFQELVASWNVHVPAGAGMCFELRVREDSSAPWTPWMYVGDWGQALPPTLYLRRADPGGPRVDFTAPRTVKVPGGELVVDYFKSDTRWTRAQYRVRTHVANPEVPQIVRLRRVALCFSRRGDGSISAGSPRAARERLAVPFRSQKAEKAELAPRICSPTSLAMVMAFHGVEVPTTQVAQRCFDSTHDIFGNWPRAVQSAYSFGLPGYVARFASWSEVESRLAARQPLVISIAAGVGELSGAPYPATEGHLLVLAGLDGAGGALVCDPAAPDAASGVTTYKLSELERVWMARGGTAYVLAPREK